MLGAAGVILRTRKGGQAQESRRYGTRRLSAAEQNVQNLPAHWVGNCRTRGMSSTSLTTSQGVYVCAYMLLEHTITDDLRSFHGGGAGSGLVECRVHTGQEVCTRRCEPTKPVRAREGQLVFEV